MNTQIINKLTKLVGSPFFLIIHTMFISAVFISRFLGVLNDSIFLMLIAAVAFEAIYLTIFLHAAVNRNTRSILAQEADILAIKEEEKQAHKLLVNILHLAHQLKTLQQDIDSLKKNGVFKKTNGNGHRIHA